MDWPPEATMKSAERRAFLLLSKPLFCRAGLAPLLLLDSSSQRKLGPILIFEPSSRRTPGSSAFALKPSFPRRRESSDFALLCRAELAPLLCLRVLANCPALSGPGFRALSRPAPFPLLTQKKVTKENGLTAVRFVGALTLGAWPP